MDTPNRLRVYCQGARERGGVSFRDWKIMGRNMRVSVDLIKRDCICSRGYLNPGAPPKAEGLQCRMGPEAFMLSPCTTRRRIRLPVSPTQGQGTETPYHKRKVNATRQFRRYKIKKAGSFLNNPASALLHVIRL